MQCSLPYYEHGIENNTCQTQFITSYLMQHKSHRLGYRCIPKVNSQTKGNHSKSLCFPVNSPKRNSQTSE